MALVEQPAAQLEKHLETPPQSPQSDAATPVPKKPLEDIPTPTDSMVSIDLSEPSRNSDGSILVEDTTAKDLVEEVLKRASESPTRHRSEIEVADVVDSPGAEARLMEEVAFEKERARAGSRRGSVATTSGRDRSDSAASEKSVDVDWESLDRTETQQTNDQDDEQTTLLLARLEQENNAIATDPKNRIQRRVRGQSRPPSILHLQKLVQEQGARSVRFSLLPTAAPMTELDFWAALVRDYPQTAQRLPTITSNKIRSGIPPPLRGVTWVSMSGARERAIEEQYDKLYYEPSPYENMIGKDVGRSFPQHEMFRDPNGDGQRMLGSVLKCYSLYDDKIGYCQGLGFLVGPLLMNMGDKEAFCILVRLMEDYGLRSCFLPDLSGLHLRIYQFNTLLRQHVPKVSAHLEMLGVEGEYLSQWFLSFFAVTCPLPLLFRIYDVIFAEGASETIMRVALAIVRRNERKILGYSEFEDVMQLLLSRQLWDVYGLSPASADEFVHDFVSFTSLVTRESLNAVEANFREAQNRSGGRNSFLPNVSSAASRFLGRLWTTTPKQQTLTPGNVPIQQNSRPTSRLLRTPSKQSLSTISSAEGASESSASTASTAMTDVSMISRDSSNDAFSFKSSKSPESMPPPSRHRHQQSTSTSKERELDSQIEDLLTVLSEMQKNQALLTAQLQKMQEDRNEDNIAVRAFIDQVRLDMSVPLPKARSHRRAASAQITKAPDADHRKISPTTIRLLDSLETRLSSRHHRRSSNYETKADLRHTIATVREQLHVESTRSQELTRQLDTKEQELSNLRDEVSHARARIKDSHFDKQRLEKTVLDLRQAQRRPSRTPTRSNSKSSTHSEHETELPDAAGKGGLRELRLGRGPGISRTNSNGPTQVFAKRTSSLAFTNSEPGPGSLRHAATVSAPTFSTTHPENDSILLELANAKTAEAIARQELEEMRARFDALRRSISSGASSPAPTAPMTIATSEPLAATRIENSSGAGTPTAVPTPPVSGGGSFGGFFGWGKKA
ncbi:hypothetical protein BT63DRAFT_27113 [Microthyrium microscopicum]|uniref:Rab-GAP TBC domain-containing protein n=1 Tax=Microthyrium microscopicum TaxID=703497 RepID=A0A6A6URT8_9PEZI|nr:hypothetical protein BT63DRAFT_27113 [Microthyrium microscopicum]